MNKKRNLLFIVAILMVSCTSATYMKPPYDAPSDEASIKLAEAANSVSDSMLEMARIQKTIASPHADNVVKIPNAYPLQTRASVDWSGPIEEVTARIAKAANFRLRVLGREPAVPVLIGLNSKNLSLAEILRDIDYQAGKKASLYVYPNSKIIELRYAKIYS